MQRLYNCCKLAERYDGAPWEWLERPDWYDAGMACLSADDARDSYLKRRKG
jgi:hypothetical protein